MKNLKTKRKLSEKANVSAGTFLGVLDIYVFLVRHIKIHIISYP
jgi:hypothetical protein